MTPALASLLILVPNTTAGNPQQPLRRRLLDVAGGDAADASGAKPDGKFDEKDLENFVKAFKDAEGSRLATDPPDRSRFDLNGDGFTGGPTTASFDLNGPSGAIGSSVLSTVTIQIRNVPVEFDETALTDLQILCFYAYSMYTGSARERGRILGAGCCPLPPMLAFEFRQGDGSVGGVQIISAISGAVGYQAYLNSWPDNQSQHSYGTPTWKPDGSELAFRGPNSTIYDSDIQVVRVGSELSEVAPFAQLTSGPDHDYHPVYFAHEEPNGDTFFFTRRGNVVPNLIPLGVYVGQNPGMGPPRLINRYEGFFFGYSSLAGHVSPNNEKVYKAEVSPGHYSLRAMNSSGVTRTLTPEDVNVGNTRGAYWSPDGASVAWSTGFPVKLLNVASREIRTLATNNWDTNLSWSPDGRQLVYEYFDIGAGQRGLATVDLQGGPPVPLTPTGGSIAGATWSPDGKEIAFVRDNDVWVRTLATGAERQLTFTPQVYEFFLVWRPGSKTEP